jgi:hypothetical protein
MKNEFEMVLDENPVTLSISRMKVSLDGERVGVKTASIGKKRKNSTFKIILYILAVMAVGVLLYAALNTFIGGGEEGEPFQELDALNNIKYREYPDMEKSSLFLITEGGELIDLSGSVTWKSGSMDLVELESGVTGSSTLYLMWYGSANDLATRNIGHLKIVIESGNDHYLRDVDLVVLDIEDLISKRVEVTLPSSIVYEKGRSIYDIHVGRMEMGAARINQSGISSSMKGTLIKVDFPNGLSPGIIKISAEWGPDYYHETTPMGMLIAGVCLIITLGALFFVYTRVAKDEACLVLDTEEREYVLFGDHGDISNAYLEISKITIPKMKGADERRSERPGMTMGKDLIDKDEAAAIGKELKKRPGGSGKMIVHQCPECMGTELYYETGFLTGYKYHCKNCDYVGSFVIEKQVDFDQ